MTLHVHSSGDPGCAVDGVTISVDMAASIGRWGARLWPALATSAVGVAVLVLFDALGRIEDGSTSITFTSVPNSADCLFSRGADRHRVPRGVHLLPPA